MSPPLAEFTFGQALLTVIEIFLFIIWIWLVITIMLDVFRDRDLSGGWKALWVFFLIFVPVLTALVYLIFRGNGMRDRAIEHQREMQQAANDYIRTVAASPADELHKLGELHAKGILTDAEFASAKAKVVA
jgi:ABC-type multidrug transport system fused ATPase/permease subunit